MIDSVDERERSRASLRRAHVRRRRAALAGAAALALAAGLAVGAGGDGEAPRPAQEPAPEGVSESPEEAVDKLSLEQQAGHMVIMRFAGTEAPAYVREALREGRAAGVILFRDNVVDPEQLRALTDSLRRAAPRTLICVDQEGGEIRVLPWAQPERPPPEQQAFGAVREDSLAAGRDLEEAGINVTLGPVADVPAEGSVMTNRAFTSDPEAAVAAVAESVAGWREAGVGTTVKHFPGLGGASVNTDEGSATVDRTRRQLNDDLAPFAVAISEGTEFVMVSHALYPALDDERIASQSSAVVEDLLRGELGFEGVIMTDSLEAQAVLNLSDVDEAAIASAAAGVDLMLTTGRGSYLRVQRALLRRAREDEAFRERVRTSAMRVLAAQSSLDG
jgi:beta-N-acetylhexosaminidase